jgi:Mor family transcriptional regulator
MMGEFDLPAIDELPGDLRLIAEVIGIEPTMKLAQAFGGTPLYIVKIDAFARRLRDKGFREEFDRRTAEGETATTVVRDMARRRDLCERQVWNIVNAPDERQMRMF